MAYLRREKDPRREDPTAETSPVGTESRAIVITHVGTVTMQKVLGIGAHTLLRVATNPTNPTDLGRIVVRAEVTTVTMGHVTVTVLTASVTITDQDKEVQTGHDLALAQGRVLNATALTTLLQIARVPNGIRRMEP